MAAPISRYNKSIARVTAFLTQIDPKTLAGNDIASSLAHLHRLRPSSPSALAAVTTALLDLTAKRANKPLHQFLQIPFKEGQYATSFTIGIDSPEIVRRKVLAATRSPGAQTENRITSNRENLQALREIAPAKPVRIDANEACKTKEQAMEMLEWLARDGNVQLVEQPMPASRSSTGLDLAEKTITSAHICRRVLSLRCGSRAGVGGI